MSSSRGYLPKIKIAMFEKKVKIQELEKIQQNMNNGRRVPLFGERLKVKSQNPYFKFLLTHLHLLLLLLASYMMMSVDQVG